MDKRILFDKEMLFAQMDVQEEQYEAYIKWLTDFIDSRIKAANIKEG